MQSVSGVAFYRLKNTVQPQPLSPPPSPSNAREVSGFKATEGRDFPDNKFNIGGSECPKDPSVCGRNCQNKDGLKGT
jgi:hypothetical protein